MEQELARRARRHLGGDLTFCIYDRFRNAMLELDEEMAQNFIEGHVQIRIEPNRSLVEKASRQALRSIQLALMANASVYHLVQSMRGRRFTRDEVEAIRSRERSTTVARHTPLPDLKPAPLDADTIWISGGLDWQYKDLRDIWHLKQKHQFKYWPVVYDLIPILFPHYVVPGYVEKLTDYFGELCWLSDHVMCISETTRKDWIRYCEEIRAEQVPAQVFPLGCDIRAPLCNGCSPQLPVELADKRYALFVSTIEPRKNHRVLYDAWDDCMREGLLDPVRDRLVFVGRRGWAMGDFLGEVLLNPATRNSIVILNDVDDAQLNLVYENATMVLYPSHYEGFGLPVAEALARGKFCISSDSGALPEIGGDAVLRLNPRDALAWKQAIAHYMRSPEEIKRWTERIAAGYRPTTWDTAAEIFFSQIAASAH